MKTTLAIILIVAAIAIVAVYAANKQPQQTITEISVLGDITEKYFYKPKPEELLPVFGLDKDKWNGAKFRNSNISDVDFNQVMLVTLEPANKWLSNEFERDEAINHFNLEVEKNIAQTNEDTLGREHTSAYLPIARELNRLSQSKSNRKILIVYSDLMEHENALSFYRQSKLDSLQKYPGVLFENFEKQITLNDLNGIEVFLVYQPVNITDSERFRMVSGFYKNLLESKGATITIGANLVL